MNLSDYIYIRAYKLPGLDKSNKIENEVKKAFSTDAFEALLKLAKNLDYSLECIKERKIHIRKNDSKFILDLILTSAEDVNQLSWKIWHFINRHKILHKEDFNYIANKDIHIVAIEVFDYTFIKFNSFGNWPSVFYTKDLDTNNYLTFSDKSKCISLFDTAKQEFYKPELY